MSFDFKDIFGKKTASAGANDGKRTVAAGSKEGRSAEGNRRAAAYSSQLAFKGGTYTTIMTVIVLAILVVVNVMTSLIPTKYTQYDISSTQLYSITSNTKVVVNGLDKDVTIYWICQAGEEDDVISHLLDRYASLSDHITVEKKDPDVYPTFAANYTDDDVSNNSLIVECGDKNRFISYDDIYISDVDYTTYSYVYSFDGEGQITSAIRYVVSEDEPKLYLLQGHGESDLPDDLTSQINKANIETDTFSLLNEDEIPEDADAILIYAPTSDISEDEEKLLADYAADGGKLMVIAGPAQDDEMTNLYTLLSDYGVTSNDGIVIEGDRSHYALQAPYILLPDLQTSDITSPLIEESYYVIMPIARGLTVGTTSNGTVTELLTTSDDAFNKVAGYNLQSYDKEDGDEDGPFALAVSVETNGGGSIVWVASSNFLDDQYNAYSSGANLDFTMNALNSLTGQDESMSIATKSLGYNYLTISDTQSIWLKAVMIGILPAAFVVLGIVMIVVRRRRRTD